MEADQYIRKAREATRATIEMEAAQRKQQKALSDVARAEKNLHDAQRSGDTQKVTRATRELETARERLATANDRVVLAEKKLQSETERTAATIERTAARAASSKEAAERRIVAASRREAREAEQAARKTEQLARQQERSDKVHLDNRLRNIVAASVILGPALVPIGAVAAAGVGAFAEAAGVALLAVRGIKQEMKAGSQTGLQYTAMFKGLSVNLDALSSTAAETALPFVAQGVGQINDIMPELNRETQQYTALLGQMGDVILHGALRGLVDLQPVILQVTKDALGLAKGFDRFASGGGFAKFGNYALEVLPIVEKDLGDIIAALGKLIIASAGSGVTILELLGGISRALNAIPLPVLKIIVPTLLSLYTASKLVAIGTSINIRLGAAYAAMLGREVVATEALTAAQLELALAQKAADHRQVAAVLGPQHLEHRHDLGLGELLGRGRQAHRLHPELGADQVDVLADLAPPVGVVGRDDHLGERLAQLQVRLRAGPAAELDDRPHRLERRDQAGVVERVDRLGVGGEVDARLGIGTLAAHEVLPHLVGQERHDRRDAAHGLDERVPERLVRSARRRLVVGLPEPRP
jgi:hypothetical protein